MVNRNPRPLVAKPERQLYEPPTLQDRSKTQSPTAELAKKPSEPTAGQSTPEGKTEQLRFFIPPALQDRSRVGWKQPVFDGATNEQRFLISLQKQGVKFRPMETFEGDWMYENNLARFYARYQEANTILKQREKEKAEFGVQLETDPHEEIEMIITELMKKDKMWTIERERGLSTLKGERK